MRRVILLLALLLASLVQGQVKTVEAEINLQPGQSVLWGESDTKSLERYTDQGLVGAGYGVNHTVGLKPNAARSNQYRQQVLQNKLKVITPSFPFPAMMWREGSASNKRYVAGRVAAGDPQYVGTQPVRWKHFLSMAQDHTIWLVRYEVYEAVAAVACGNDYKPRPLVIVRTMTPWKQAVRTKTVTETKYEIVKQPWFVYVDRPVPVPVATVVPQHGITVLAGGMKTNDKVEFTTSSSSGMLIYQDSDCFDFSKYCQGGGVSLPPPPLGDLPAIGTPPNNPEHGPTPFGGPYVGPPIVPNGPGGYKNANGGQSSSGGGGPPPA